jgi:hypothetical protein
MNIQQLWVELIASAAMRAIGRGSRHAAAESRGTSEVTDEIRRYDIEDLILS